MRHRTADPGRIDDVETVATEQQATVGRPQARARVVFAALQAVRGAEGADRAGPWIEPSDAKIGTEPDVAAGVLEHAVNGVVGQSVIEPVALEMRGVRVDALETADAGHRADPNVSRSGDQNAADGLARQ